MIRNSKNTPPGAQIPSSSLSRRRRETKEPKDLKPKHTKEIAGSNKPIQSGPGLKIDPQRKQALDFALQQIHKRCGQGSIMFLGEESTRRMEAISTGSISLDKAIGIGGFPRSRVIEVYGPESSIAGERVKKREYEEPPP